MVVPLTVKVSPGANPLESESVPAAPDNAVAPVIGAGGTAWLFATLPVATLSVLKKLSPAATAEAATSEVAASVPIDEFRAAFRFAAVAAGVAPIVKLPLWAGDVLVAVNWMESVVPSGSLKLKVIWSPGFGLPAVMSTETEGGEPAGPVTVALVSDDETELSLKPKGEPAASSATLTDVAVGCERTSRPSPLAPRSACWRSAIT